MFSSYQIKEKKKALSLYLSAVLCKINSSGYDMVVLKTIPEILSIQTPDTCLQCLAEAVGRHHDVFNSAVGVITASLG